MRRPAAELAIAVGVAAAVAGIARLVIAASGFDALSSGAHFLGAPWAAAMIAIAAAGYFARRHGRWVVAVLAGLAGGIAMVPLMAGLNGTDQPPFTIAQGDMEFRTEYVTRFASTWHLDDYTFRGLHAFYPPGWFWTAGRTAHLLGIDGWRMMAPFSIATIGVALLVSFGLWRALLRPAAALAAAVGSSLVLPAQRGGLIPGLQFTTQGWYSSYSCFVAVTGVAWVAATVASVRRGGRGRLVVLTLAGAVLALTYYLLFIVLVVALFAVVVLGREGRRQALLRAVSVCGGVALLTAIFWIPLLAATLGGNPTQGHFVVPAFYRVSTGIGGPIGLTALTVVAVAALVLSRRALAARVVAAAILAAIAYQAVSVVTLRLWHNQLQPHRAITLMWAAYGAAVPVAYEALRRHGTRALLLPLLALPAVFALGAAQGSDLASGPLTRAAHRRPAMVRADRMAAFIKQVTRRPPQQLTLLTDNHLPLITRPYWSFLPLRARYAHPEARPAERLAVVASAGACRVPSCLTGYLTHSRFGRVDAVILSRTPTGLYLDTDEDALPRPRVVTLGFRAQLFDPTVWVRRDFRDYTAFVRPPGR